MSRRVRVEPLGEQDESDIRERDRLVAYRASHWRAPSRPCGQCRAAVPPDALDSSGLCESCQSQSVLFAKKPYQRVRRWA